MRGETYCVFCTCVETNQAGSEGAGAKSPGLALGTHGQDLQPHTPLCVCPWTSKFTPRRLSFPTCTMEMISTPGKPMQTAWERPDSYLVLKQTEPPSPLGISFACNSDSASLKLQRFCVSNALRATLMLLVPDHTLRSQAKRCEAPRGQLDVMCQ